MAFNIKSSGSYYAYFDDSKLSSNRYYTLPNENGTLITSNSTGSYPFTASRAVNLEDGAVTTTKIVNDAVTYGKIQNVTGQRLLGRADSVTGDTQEISLGTGLSFDGTTLNTAGASVTNAGNNRVITSDGGTGLVGESNMQFDGSVLAVTGSVTASSTITAPRFTGSLENFQYSHNTNYTDGVGIGASANNNYVYGVGIGILAATNHTYGVGIGYGAYDNHSRGIGIGDTAYNNNNYGIGIGANAGTNNAYGIGIGDSALQNNASGVGVGSSAQNNSTSGVGIGNSALNNYNHGVGIGRNAQNNHTFGVGVGAYATSNARGTGTVAIGAYSKAERSNEFVTTATNSETNKAQSIIQKFAAVSRGGTTNSTTVKTFQTLFTSTTNTGTNRLIFFADSIYSSMFQINAIANNVTPRVVRHWNGHIVIKRSGTGDPVIVGQSTTQTIGDSSTMWDIQFSIDNVNDALVIQYTHHPISTTVTYSATLWTTETRI
jgi:hypothetical protein